MPPGVMPIRAASAGLRIRCHDTRIRDCSEGESDSYRVTSHHRHHRMLDLSGRGGVEFSDRTCSPLADASCTPFHRARLIASPDSTNSTNLRVDRSVTQVSAQAPQLFAPAEIQHTSHLVN